MKTQTVINITNVEWANYFCDLLNQPINKNEVFTNQVENILKEHTFIECNDCKDGENEQLDIFNCDFTSTEIISCIKEISSGESPGSNGITMEMIKSSTQNLVPFLVELFNTILHSGDYPQQWREAIICPIHKKGLYMIHRIIEVFLYFVFLVRFLQRLLILVFKHGQIAMT